MSNDHAIAPGDAQALETARQNRNKATKAIWIIFGVALLIAIALRAERTWVACDSITALATTIAATFKDTDATVAEIVVTSATELFPDAEKDLGVEGFRALTQVLAYKLHRPGAPDLGEQENVAAFLHDVRLELLMNLAVVVLMHAALLIIFPLTFTVTLWRAAEHLAKHARSAPRDGQRSFWNAVWWRRHQKFLAEEARPFIGRRFAFAILISLSILYMLAPAGLLASSIGEYISLYAIPGRPSPPFWFAEFSQVSPFVLGMAGFLLYSLITFAQRFLTFDVTNRLFLSLWNRGITVVILSLVLTAVDEGSTISKALIFIAGIFPSTGLQAIAKIAQTGADRLASIESKGLSALPEIDSIKEGSLRELGIFDVSDLANADLPNYLIITSRIEPRCLLKAVDRALLQAQLGELADKLKGIPVFTASELVLYALGSDAYSDRWTADQLQRLRPLADHLSDAEKQERLANINSAMEVQDAELHIRKLKQNLNLKCILDNQLCYQDV